MVISYSSVASKVTPSAVLIFSWPLVRDTVRSVVAAVPLVESLSVASVTAALVRVPPLSMVTEARNEPDAMLKFCVLPPPMETVGVRAVRATSKYLSRWCHWQSQ